MARLPYLEVADLKPDDRKLLSRDINLAKILVHSPDGARAFNHLGGWIRSKSNLDGRLREMAILRVGVLARAPYEYSHHIKIGRDFGMSDDDIRHVIEGPGAPGLGEIEQLVVLAADEMTADGGMTADTFAALHTHLSSELMVDLALVISFYNAVVRFLSTMDIDVEPDYEQYLDEFPLP